MIEVDAQAFVLLRHPWSWVHQDDNGRWVIYDDTGKDKKAISGRCASQEAAWQSAARRFGWVRKKPA